MKLATYKDGSRDGQLVVVSRDLGTAHYATGIASKLQQVLDDWSFLSPQLQDLYDQLNSGRARHPFPFDPAQCMAPLPRAYQWADGSAYINHVELVRKARNSEVPESFYTDPLMYQGGSDDFIGPCDPVVVPSESMGIDFEAEIAVITGDVKMGATPEQALEGIRLVMIANDVSLRNLIPAELAKGFGFFQSKPATAFSPVAVTLDELGDAWDKGRVNLTVQSTHYYILENAYHLIMAARFEPKKTASDIWKSYIAEDHAIDQKYRYFYYHYDQVLNNTPFENLRDLVENIYTNRYHIMVQKL